MCISCVFCVWVCAVPSLSLAVTLWSVWVFVYVTMSSPGYRACVRVCVCVCVQNKQYIYLVSFSLADWIQAKRVNIQLDTVLLLLLLLFTDITQNDIYLKTYTTIPS